MDGEGPWTDNGEEVKSCVDVTLHGVLVWASYMIWVDGIPMTTIKLPLSL